MPATTDACSRVVKAPGAAIRGADAIQSGPPEAVAGPRTDSSVGVMWGFTDLYEEEKQVLV